jgi:hypothetical protein
MNNRILHRIQQKITILKKELIKAKKIKINKRKKAIFSTTTKSETHDAMTERVEHDRKIDKTETDKN